MCFGSVWNLFLNEVIFLSAEEGTEYQEVVGYTVQSLIHICWTEKKPPFSSVSVFHKKTFRVSSGVTVALKFWVLIMFDFLGEDYEKVNSGSLSLSSFSHVSSYNYHVVSRW